MVHKQPYLFLINMYILSRGTCISFFLEAKKKERKVERERKRGNVKNVFQIVFVYKIHQYQSDCVTVKSDDMSINLLQLPTLGVRNNAYIKHFPYNQMILDLLAQFCFLFFL